MKIDFYVLETASEQKSLHFVCQLIEKVYAEQQHIYVNMGSRHKAERLDALLWIYRDDSFLPHNLYHSTHNYPSPIQIGFNETPNQHQAVLLNLCQDVPSFYQQFQHVIEIVFLDPLMQQLARARYKQYRDDRCEINTIKQKANET